LQIQGDDVLIFHNCVLSERLKSDIQSWSLDNLNYRIEIKGLLNSSVDSPKHLKSSFLKRIIHNNLLDTKLEDVFDKLLFGNIKCKPKVSKKAYNFRRLKDLVVADRDDVLIIAKYYALIDLLDGKEQIVEDIFNIFNDPYQKEFI